MNDDLYKFYKEAKEYVLTHGYADEVKWCEQRKPFNECDAETFFCEYVYVILNAGMREQIARKIYERFMEKLNPDVIGHKGKRAATEKAMWYYKEWFKKLRHIEPETLIEAQQGTAIAITTKPKFNIELRRKKTESQLKKYQAMPINELRIEYLKTLSWIGDITKYHLARNIGIDCVKPDRHLVRLAAYFKFKTPLEMCIDIQKTTKERLGVIDVIFWRYCNLKGSNQFIEEPNK